MKQIIKKLFKKHPKITELINLHQTGIITQDEARDALSDNYNIKL